MKYRKMRKYGIKLSEISIGPMYHGPYIKKEAALACLNEALNQGIERLVFKAINLGMKLVD